MLRVPGHPSGHGKAGLAFTAPGKEAGELQCAAARGECAEGQPPAAVSRSAAEARRPRRPARSLAAAARPGARAARGRRHAPSRDFKAGSLVWVRVCSPPLGTAALIDVTSPRDEAGEAGPAIVPGLGGDVRLLGGGSWARRHAFISLTCPAGERALPKAPAWGEVSPLHSRRDTSERQTRSQSLKTSLTPPPWKPALASYTHLFLFIKESPILSETSGDVLGPSSAPSIAAPAEKEGRRQLGLGTIPGTQGQRRESHRVIRGWKGGGGHPAWIPQTAHWHLPRLRERRLDPKAGWQQVLPAPQAGGKHCVLT